MQISLWQITFAKLKTSFETPTGISNQYLMYLIHYNIH